MALLFPDYVMKRNVIVWILEWKLEEYFLIYNFY